MIFHFFFEIAISTIFLSSYRPVNVASPGRTLRRSGAAWPSRPPWRRWIILEAKRVRTGAKRSEAGDGVGVLLAPWPSGMEFCGGNFVGILWLC